jgi:large subunit ribosomal protein L29
MKISEIRLMSNEELVTKLGDTRQEYMNIRFQIATGQQTDTSRLAAMRKTVAQFETILRERQLNINQDLVVKARAAKPKASKRPTKETKVEAKETAAREGVAIPSEEEQRKEVAREKAPKKAKPAATKEKTVKPAKKPAASKAKTTNSTKTKEGDK